MVTLRGSRRGERQRRRVRSLLVFGSAALAYLAFLTPAEGLDSWTSRRRAVTEARLAADAFGRSGQLRMRFALPGAVVEYPIEVQGDVAPIRYTWVPLGATPATDSAATGLSLVNGLVAPDQPGFYRLELAVAGARQVVDGPMLAVLVPFTEKKGIALNGYRIGYYRGERVRRATVEAPAGFVQIDTTHLDIPVSRHLRLGDLITRDQQTTWPRYAAIDPRLVEKIELVIGEIAGWYGGVERAGMSVDVRSGYRTPLHNLRVAHAARDSRHQLGDALDLAVDANRDGRVNAKDTRLVSLAVEVVERSHPDLVGGMGVYARSGGYIHIDARGTRVRWRG